MSSSSDKRHCLCCLNWHGDKKSLMKWLCTLTEPPLIINRVSLFYRCYQNPSSSFVSRTSTCRSQKRKRIFMTMPCRRTARPLVASSGSTAPTATAASVHPLSHWTLTLGSSGSKRSPMPVMMRQWPLRAWLTSRAPTFTRLTGGWWYTPWYEMTDTSSHLHTKAQADIHATCLHCFGSFGTGLIRELVKWSVYCTLYVLYIIE